MPINIEFTACPDPQCQLPAEVSEHFELSSTDGPVEFVRTYCVRRHIFTVPVERVDSLASTRS